MGELKESSTQILEPGAAGGAGFATTRLEAVLAWAQKYSLFMYPFVTACCGMEFMSVSSPRYDFSRFGSEAPRFSPRQSDLLWVVGTITQRQAPILKRIYEQMAEPKWVLAFGTCASCGGFYDNYACVAGVDKVIPCDVYVPGGSAGWPDAAPGQDPNRQPHARDRQAPPRSGGRAEHWPGAIAQVAHFRRLSEKELE
jgi:NADH-quinone oxidoreductase subunit B